MHSHSRSCIWTPYVASTIKTSGRTGGTATHAQSASTHTTLHHTLFLLSLSLSLSRSCSFSLALSRSFINTFTNTTTARTLSGHEMAVFLARVVARVENAHTGDLKQELRRAQHVAGVEGREAHTGVVDHLMVVHHLRDCVCECAGAVCACMRVWTGTSIFSHAALSSASVNSCSSPADALDTRT